jgi:hypothetical protein
MADDWAALTSLMLQFYCSRLLTHQHADSRG